MHSLSPYFGAAYPPAKNKAVFGWLRGICFCTEWGRIVCFSSKNHLGLAGTACAVMVRNVCCLKFFPCPHGDKHVSCTAGRDFFSAKPACPFSCIKVAKNIRHAVFCPIGCRNVFFRDMGFGFDAKRMARNHYDFFEKTDRVRVLPGRVPEGWS